MGLVRAATWRPGARPGQQAQPGQQEPTQLRVSPGRPGRIHRRRRGLRQPWYVREAALAVVLVAVTAGLLAISQDYWRRGLLAIGSVLLAAGLVRLLAPTRLVGLLAVRSRLFDVVMLAVLGAGIIGLTLAVPVPGSS